MARLTSDIKFEGSLDSISAYRMEGVDHIVIRRKGGPSKAKIMKSPRFARVRENISEFGGRAKATSLLNKAMPATRMMADFNFTAVLNALLRPIQKDASGKRGERGIALSQNPKILNGFSMNRKTPFDSIIRYPLTYSLSRDERKATITFPELLPGITFNPQNRFSYFRFVVNLGLVPDLQIKNEMFMPTFFETYRVSKHTEWLSTAGRYDEMSLELELPERPGTDAFIVLLSVGISYGMVDPYGSVEMVRRAGGAKILAAV